jgi:hypothetical protein
MTWEDKRQRTAGRFARCGVVAWALGGDHKRIEMMRDISRKDLVATVKLLREKADPLLTGRRHQLFQPVGRLASFVQEQRAAWRGLKGER